MFQIRTFQVLALVLLVLTASTACSRLSGAQNRGTEAWGQRLTQQAEFLRQEQARAERSKAAWAQRLTEQAESILGDQRMSSRAIAAWSDRLTGLAEYYGAGR